MRKIQWILSAAVVGSFLVGCKKDETKPTPPPAATPTTQPAEGTAAMDFKTKIDKINDDIAAKKWSDASAEVTAAMAISDLTKAQKDELSDAKNKITQGMNAANPIPLTTNPVAH